jgi:hypothetical protein
MSNNVDPDESLILFGDKRHCEFRRRQSVITVDDIDVLIQERGTGVSRFNEGELQGPNFWNQLKSAWNHHQQHTPSPSPTCVRDIQELDDYQGGAIFNAKPHCLTSYNKYDYDFSLGIKVHHVKDEDASQTNNTTRTSSSNDSMDISRSSSSCRPLSSMWDRLDFWSLKENTLVQDCHATVQTQIENFSAISKVGHNEETFMAPRIPAKREFGSQGPALSGITSVAPHHLRGRLRRQHSWNGRDSNRDLIQAKGSIMAIADEDGSLSDLCSALDRPIDDCKHENNCEQHSSRLKAASRLERIIQPTTSTMKKTNSARRKADQRVMDLVM